MYAFVYVFMVISSFFLFHPTSVGELWKAVWLLISPRYPVVGRWPDCRVPPPGASVEQRILCLASQPVASATTCQSPVLPNEYQRGCCCLVTQRGSPLVELVAFRVVASRWSGCERCMPPRLQLFVLCQSWGRVAKVGSSSLAQYPRLPPQEHRAAGCSPRLCAVV